MENRASIDLKLIDCFSLIKRRWIPATSIFVTTVTIGILSAFLLKSSYATEGKLLFKNSTFKVVGANLVPGQGESGDSDDLKPLVSNQNPITTQIEIISSRPLLQRTIEQLKLKNDRGLPLTVKELQSALTFKIVGGADVLKISGKGHNPKQVASIVNTLMKLYVENDLQIHSAEVEATRRFMNNRLPATQAAVEQAEVALSNFKQQHKIVDLSEEAKSAVGIIGGLETGITANQAQLREASAQIRELHQKINLDSRQAITVSAIGQSPAIQGILNQLQEIDRQLATENSRFSTKNPIVLSLKDKKSQLKLLLEQQITGTIGSNVKIPQKSLRIGELKQNLIKDLLQSEMQRTGAIEKITSFQNSRIAYQKRMSVMPQLIRLQRQLERKLEVSQSTHQTLLKKVQELQLVKDKTISNARIISSATVPESSDSGEKLIVGGASILLGLLLASSAIAYWEIKDKFIETKSEIPKIFGCTLLGIVAARDLHNRDASSELTTLEFAVRDIPRPLASAMSQVVQVNLKFVGSEKVLRIITVTDTGSSEEKSKMAAKLATAIANAGQKVLLIDADLHNPHQHDLWKLPLGRGLSDILSGDFEFKKISQATIDNLDIVTAGTIPSNPLFYFKSQKMKSLIHQISDLYDFVIIDTPPILVATNALMVGQMTDGILTIELESHPERAAV